MRRQEKQKRVPAPWKDDNRVHQSERHEADINKMMEQYTKTNDLVHISKSMPKYGDFSEVPSFHEGMIQVREAQAMFMELPATVRSMVDNDPAKFIDWIVDPKNKVEAIELGLVEGPSRVAEEDLEVVAKPKTGVPDGSVQGGE